LFVDEDPWRSISLQVAHPLRLFTNCGNEERVPKALRKYRNESWNPSFASPGLHDHDARADRARAPHSCSYDLLNKLIDGCSHDLELRQSVGVSGKPNAGGSVWLHVLVVDWIVDLNDRSRRAQRARYPRKHFSVF
jgi:hypothetical protein